MMQTRLNYQICSLHDEPLNYLCLHAKCNNDRLICAICKEQRHSNFHLTIPLKIYLSHKTQQLKCLTDTKLQAIRKSLHQQSQTIKIQILKIQQQISHKFSDLLLQSNKFFNDKLKMLNQYQKIIASELLEVENIEAIEKTLEMILRYEDHQQIVKKSLSSVFSAFCQSYKNIKFQSQITKQKWEAHSCVKIIDNSVISGQNSYKIAFLSKNISRNFNKISFRVKKSHQNWIGVGVCFGEIVKVKKFSFRYHTIGHGVYALSSNGGIWSHHQSDFNNKLGAFEIKENQIVTVNYDFNEHKVNFENQCQKFVLQTDATIKSDLNFCLLLYYEGDEVEFIPQFTVKL